MIAGECSKTFHTWWKRQICTGLLGSLIIPISRPYIIIVSSFVIIHTIFCIDKYSPFEYKQTKFSWRKSSQLNSRAWVFSMFSCFASVTDLYRAHEEHSHFIWRYDCSRVFCYLKRIVFFFFLGICHLYILKIYKLMGNSQVVQEKLIMRS